MLWIQLGRQHAFYIEREIVKRTVQLHHLVEGLWNARQHGRNLGEYERIGKYKMNASGKPYTQSGYTAIELRLLKTRYLTMSSFHSVSGSLALLEGVTRLQLWYIG